MANNGVLGSKTNNQKINNQSTLSLTADYYPGLIDEAYANRLGCGVNYNIYGVIGGANLCSNGKALQKNDLMKIDKIDGFTHSFGQKISINAQNPANQVLIETAFQRVYETKVGTELIYKLLELGHYYFITDKGDLFVELRAKLRGDNIRGAYLNPDYTGSVYLIIVDPSYRPFLNTEDGPQAIDLDIMLVHEMGHAALGLKDGQKGQTNDKRMANVIASENRYRAERGYPLRTTYSQSILSPIPEEKPILPAFLRNVK